MLTLLLVLATVSAVALTYTVRHRDHLIWSVCRATSAWQDRRRGTARRRVHRAAHPGQPRVAAADQVGGAAGRPARVLDAAYRAHLKRGAR